MFLKKINGKKSEKSFTLIELLVVIAVIGVLSSIVLVSLGSAREKAKIAKARTEVRQIHMAIFNLEGDTVQWPGHKEINKNECGGGNNEICGDGCTFGLNDEESGLLSDDSGDPYPNWSGPYYPESLIDPWGNEYFFDTDYYLDGGAGDCVVAIGSYGPDGIGRNVYNADDIIFIIPSRD